MKDKILSVIALIGIILLMFVIVKPRRAEGPKVPAEVEITDILAETLIATIKHPAGILFRVWESDSRLQKFLLYDYGFDGTLDRVFEKGKFIEPNDPNWPLWQEKYLKIRKLATEGK